MFARVALTGIRFRDARLRGYVVCDSDARTAAHSRSGYTFRYVSLISATPAAPTNTEMGRRTEALTIASVTLPSSQSGSSQFSALANDSQVRTTTPTISRAPRAARIRPMRYAVRIIVSEGRC